MAQWMKREDGSFAKIKDIHTNMDGLLVTGGIFNEELKLDNITLNEATLYVNYVTPISFSTSVDVTDEVSNNTYMFYSNDHLFFDKSRKGRLNIYNVIGKKIKAINVENCNSVKIDKLPSGIYFAKFNNSHESKTIKFIVK